MTKLTPTGTVKGIRQSGYKTIRQVIGGCDFALINPPKQQRIHSSKMIKKFKTWLQKVEIDLSDLGRDGCQHTCIWNFQKQKK